METYLPKINNLLEQSEKISDWKPFSKNIVSFYEIDSNNFLVHNNYDHFSSVLIFESPNLNIFKCKANTEVIIPRHQHNVNEHIYVINGTCRWLETHRDITCYAKIEKNTPHTILVYPNTEFLVMFVPPIQIKRVNINDR